MKWATFPCRGKHPATNNGFYDADTTGEVFKKYPPNGDGPHNIGIRTGGWFFVLDVDVKHKAGGEESLAELVAEYGPLPATVEARTWSGGSHFYFKIPDGQDIGCRTGFIRGLDIRGQGGYVIAPPSIVEGKPYTWVRDPEHHEIAEAPKWLLAIISKSRPPLAAPESQVASVTEGGRNDELCRRAGAMRAAGLDPLDIYQALSKVNAARCNPPLPETEVRQIAESVGRYAHAQDDILLAAPHDQEGHAQVFAHLHGHNTLYTREMGWMVYHDGAWDKDMADRYISEWVTDVLRRRREAAGTLKALRNKCEASRANLDAVKAICKDRLVTKLEDFNTEEHLLNCANGVLDLRTLELGEHKREYRFNYKLSTKWNPDADTQEWNDFVAQCVDERSEDFAAGVSALQLLQIAAGYSLTGDTTAETMFYVFGPARSGKGTFMTALQNVLGPMANTINIGTLTSSSRSDGQNFELAGLSTCRYLTAAETGRDTYFDAGRIKNLTGNDPIQCAFKFKDSFRYTPKFKMWISSNHEVNLDAGDDAVWDRVRAFHFATSHKDNPNTALKRRLTKGKMLEAVLLWCAQGAQAWYELQAKGRPMPRTEAMRQYLLDRKDEADYVKQFLEDDGMEKAGFEATGFVSVSDVYGKFKEFCSKNHIDKYLSLRNFINDLKRRGFIYTQKRVFEKTTRGFLIKESMQELPKVFL